MAENDEIIEEGIIAIGGAVREIERSIGLPEGTVVGLLEDDDWSFVIKFHAIAETALTELIDAAVGEPKLKKIFTRISMNGMNGKKEYLKALGLMSGERDKYLERLSWLRNQYAHNVKFIGHDLETFLSKANQSERAKFITALSTKPAKERTDKDEQGIRDNPRLWLWAVGLRIIGVIQIETEKHRKGHEEKARILNEAMEPLKDALGIMSLVPEGALGGVIGGALGVGTGGALRGGTGGVIPVATGGVLPTDG